ncbi:WD40 repeat-like protein [Backusella circina FSU 941]|nr:WD40 repeat-like protein [Backusella circina FSU 941]
MLFIKTKTKHKKHNQEFSRLVLAQTIPTRLDASPQDVSSEPEPGPNHPYGALWVLKFSKDGRYLASAGQSCVVHIWRLVFHQENEGISVLDETPFKEYRGHSADILDLAWSKNNFLLSSSMDNTVRLWHIEKNVCLCVFRHLNFVTSIQFHPKDDRFFLSGSMDGRVRIWNIPEKSVAFWNEIPGERFVTAVGFTLDGKMVTAGSHDGHVYFFETQGLKYNTQISVVNDNGRNSSYSKKGPKITGIEVMPGMPPGEEKILVSSNDSKMRLYNMKDKSLMFKYKGVVNSSLQIKANFSDDGQYIISGSEDCHVYIWRTEQASVNPFHHLQEARNKAISALEHVNESTFHINAFHHHSNQQPKRIGKWLKKRNHDDTNNQGNDDNHNKIRSRTEYFEAHDYIVTSAAFAPSKTRHLIANSKLDTIYNNTPQRRLSSSSSSSFYYNQENVGHIIATADYRGVIKVWRVDSSSSYTPKRKQQGESLSPPSSDMSSLSGINSKSAPASPVVKRNFGIFGNRQSK